MSLKLQIVSDIHAEFWPNKQPFKFIKPSAPILVLLGDTCCLGSDDDFNLYKRFVNEQLPHYDTIIIISGNHEYYFNPPGTGEPFNINTMDDCDKKLMRFCKSSKKLYYLNNRTITITQNNQKYLLIGSVLWSWIPEEQRKSIQTMMNDYKFIYTKDSKTKQLRKIQSNDIANLFIKNARYIQAQLNKAKKQGMKAIVFTHHKPYLSNKHDLESFDCAYSSDLSKLFHNPLVLWCYGHTHVADDTVINGVRFVSNPKGYPYQQTKFNASYTVSI